MIYTSHGTVEGLDRQSYRHRNLLDRRRLRRHLEDRDAPYVGVDAAVRGEGDALTVDDATMAAADVALLARRLGHEVTFFVNPSAVISGRAYYFSLLNVVLDQTSDAEVERLADLGVASSRKSGRHHFRKRFKEQLLELSSDAERHEMVRDLARRLGLGPPEAPPWLEPVDLATLARLAEAGVRIGNHGWSHGNFDRLSPAAARDSIERTRTWLHRTFGRGGMEFAVPFGTPLPPPELDESVFSVWLLSTSRRPAGRLGERLYNRVDLKL